jgi:TIR domain/NACHT domain
MPSMVFISHSSKDRVTADAICTHLESAGLSCWIAPRNIEPGSTWTKGIMQGLEVCRVFVLVFSEHANSSEHVEREVAKAFSAGLAVIPFRIKDVVPDQSLSYFLDTVQWLDATVPPLEKHLDKLVERVKKLLVNESPRKQPERREPEKISIARLPVTGKEVFGREEDIAYLDAAWANQETNVVTIIAWAGVGKSTLVNHWLRRMAAEKYRSAELVFGWSFYRQGTSGDISSADKFLDATLTWFGDPDPRLGTAWEKGERLAKLVAHRRTLLVLDGLEPLQNLPGAQEGRLRDPSLQALLRELAAFNMGLCVITTRTPVADLSDHEGSAAHRRHLEHLSSQAGAKLLRALGVKGDEADLQSAGNEFSGHCLALTLLGSYLTDAYNGDIRSRNEVSGQLAHDVRQGAHARKVMESYQTWFGEGPELSVLRMLGSF